MRKLITMRWKTLLLLIGLLAGSLLPAADTLQLKDDALLSGRILAEKPDQVFLDVGYTVLTVPRSQIARITREEPALTIRKPKKSPAPLHPAPTEPEQGDRPVQIRLPVLKS